MARTVGKKAVKAELMSKASASSSEESEDNQPISGLGKRKAMQDPPESLPDHKTARMPPSSWDEKYAALVAHKAKTGSLKSKVLKVWASNQRSLFRQDKLDQDRQEKLERIGFDFEPRCQWEDYFHQLLEFKAQNGHCRVPRRKAKEQRSSLSNWVSRQRGLYSNGALSQERIEKLESVEFVWNAGPSRIPDIQTKMIQHLQEYKSKNGHVRVPDAYQVACEEDGQVLRLGKWVANVRGKHKRDNLDPELRETLDSMGFVWKLRQTRDHLEDSEMVELLCDFKKEFGHLRVHKDYQKQVDGKTVQLGRWVKAVRTRKKKGRIDKQLKEELDAIQFVWVARVLNKTSSDAMVHWKARDISIWIEYLRNYKSKFGNVRVPSRYKFTCEDGEEVKLGQWVSYIRQKYRKGQIEQELQQQLESMGFVWKILDASTTLAQYNTKDLDSTSAPQGRGNVSETKPAKKK